jgi:hypothetical protein
MFAFKVGCSYNFHLEGARSAVLRMPPQNTTFTQSLMQHPFTRLVSWIALVGLSAICAHWVVDSRPLALNVHLVFILGGVWTIAFYYVISCGRGRSNQSDFTFWGGAALILGAIIFIGALHWRNDGVTQGVIFIYSNALLLLTGGVGANAVFHSLSA